jgi:hypothetical protein
MPKFEELKAGRLGARAARIYKQRVTGFDQELMKMVKDNGGVEKSELTLRSWLRGYDQAIHLREELAYELKRAALDAACKAVQDMLGQTDGGVAMAAFENHDPFFDFISSYVNQEIEAAYEDKRIWK